MRRWHTPAGRCAAARGAHVAGADVMSDQPIITILAPHRFRADPVRGVRRRSHAPAILASAAPASAATAVVSRARPQPSTRHAMRMLQAVPPSGPCGCGTTGSDRALTAHAHATKATEPANMPYECNRAGVAMAAAPWRRPRRHKGLDRRENCARCRTSGSSPHAPTVAAATARTQPPSAPRPAIEHATAPVAKCALRRGNIHAHRTARATTKPRRWCRPPARPACRPCTPRTPTRWRVVDVG